jgi:hypothetical protein
MIIYFWKRKANMPQQKHKTFEEKCIERFLKKIKEHEKAIHDLRDQIALYEKKQKEKEGGE